MMLRFLGLDTMIELYRGLGPLRFFALFGGVLAVILFGAALHMWLAGHVGWPEAYGFHCRGRGCWIDGLIHSPRLLQRGTAWELALFAEIWFLPAVLIVGAIWAPLARRYRKYRNRILPMDD